MFWLRRFRSTVPSTLLRGGHPSALADFEGSFVKSAFAHKGLAVIFLQDHVSDIRAGGASAGCEMEVKARGLGCRTFFSS